MATTTHSTTLFVPTQKWWKSATIYQIYPSSFNDSNADGVGDLNGITQRLNYLKDLGVDVVWTSPVYKSPMKDMGYDVSDYRDIDPRYGALEDWDKLAKAVHDRGMKIMMDLVVNHSSEEHPWFKESRSSKANPKRDWYIWRPPRYDENGKRQPPSNWKASFQGSAWEWDELTKEYYLHLYLPSQPDLNWECVELREAVYDLMRFWLDRGTDGFRMDVINLISKPQDFPDAPIKDPKQEFQPASMHYANGPRVHEFLKEMNEKVLSKYEVVTVGEAPQTHDMRQLATYALPTSNELNMVIHFELMDVECPGPLRDTALSQTKWELTKFKEILSKWQGFMREDGFWNSLYLENHDQPRSVTRFGNDSSPAWRTISAKMLAILQVAQSGTLYVYQGEEIGMANFARSWGLEEYKDVATNNYYKRVLKERSKDKPVDQVDMSDVMDSLQKKARDHGRTPMQWDATPHAGFTTGTPWMRVNDDYTSWNVEAQLKDPESVLHFWKKALKVRKQYEILVYGDFQHIHPENEKVFVFTRSLGDQKALVLLNFGVEEYEVDVKNYITEGAEVILSNYAPRSEDKGSGLVLLRGYEGRIYLLQFIVK